MKKSLLILSMLAFAATASAFDTLEPGTADSPNYYVIKANRGNYRYLTCDATGVDKSLSRTNDLSAGIVWEVTPGTAEGSVNIKNHEAGVYMFNFFDTDGNPTYSGTASVSSDPVDVFPKKMDSGGYALSLYDASGLYNGHEVSLDAKSGDNLTFGNWHPVNGEGMIYWLSLVDVDNLDASFAIMNGVEELSQFVDDDLLGEFVQEGINKLKALDKATATVADVETIVEEYSLNSFFASNTFGIKNVCKSDDKYLRVTDDASGYKYSPNTLYLETWFTFMLSGDGFVLYNKLTDTYVKSEEIAGYGVDIPTTNTLSEAQVFYIEPYTSGEYSGYVLSIAKNPGNNTFCLHAQSSGSKFSYWIASDEGAIWTFEKIDSSNWVNAYASYLDNVPPTVKTIIEAAFDTEKDKEYNEVAFANLTQAMADANQELETCLDGDTWTLKNLRRAENPKLNHYLSINLKNDDFESVEAPLDETAAFRFELVSDGGYHMYNQKTNKYIALQTVNEETGAKAYVPVESVDDAQMFYPVIVASSGGYYGVSFCVNADHTGYGFNVDMNAEGKAVPYSYSDNGSIWAVAEFNEEAIVESIAKDYANQLAVYVETFPMTEAVINAAFEDMKKVKYSSTLVDDIKALEEKAIEDALAEVVKYASDNNVAMKNLRRTDASFNQPPYANVNADCSDYVMGSTANSIYGAFKLVKSGEGYQIYNEAFRVYMTLTDAGYVPTATAADAQVFYPLFYKTGAYFGLSFCVNADHTGNGINVSSYASGKPLPFDFNDDGSIWSIEDVDEAEAVANYKPVVNADLTAFGVNVPMVKEIMDVAVTSVNALNSTITTIVDDAAAVEAKAIEDGTVHINDSFHGKNISLKSLRGGQYACFTETGFGSATDNSDKSTHFAFHKDEDGNYLMGNHNMTKFLGPKGEQTDGGYPMSVVETKEDAVRVAPSLHKHSGYCGIALPLVSASRVASGDGLNYNTGLYQYTVNDGGSIWAVEEHGETTGIVEISEARAEGIYDLSGRRLAAPVKGINIINGKKVLVK